MIFTIIQESHKTALEEIYPCDKTEGMCMLMAAGKTWDCNSNSLVYPNVCPKRGEGSFAGEVNTENESEEDRRTTRHGIAVTKAALQLLYPNSLLHVLTVDGMGWFHQRDHILWLTSPFLLA